MEDRPMCACGSPVRQKGKRQDGKPMWRSKCSRCEARVVDTMVSTDLVEEMQQTQALRGELQALQVEVEKLKQSGEEQRKRILEIGVEKADLSSALEREREARAEAESRITLEINREDAQAQILRPQLIQAKAKLDALEVKASTMRELMGEADEMIKGQGLQIQNLQTGLAERDEQIEDLEQRVQNLTRESSAHLVTLAEERSAGVKASEQVHLLLEASRKSVALAGCTIEAERKQVSELLAKQRRLTLTLKAGAFFVVMMLSFFAALWVTL